MPSPQDESQKERYKSSISRIAVAFIAYFVPLLVIGIAVSRIKTPSVLTILPNQVPQIFAIVLVLVSLRKLFDAELSSYGMGIDRGWVAGAIAGVTIGIIFQTISTGALIYMGDAEVTESWTAGVFDSYLNLVFALLSTILAYSVVAVGEDLMFRGILIREFTEGIASFEFSRYSSTIIAIVISSVLFGSIHFAAGAEGLSTSVVILQAIVAGLYFGIAYALTNSLAIPVGIHLSTNVWTTVIFGQPDDGYPAAFILERSVQLEPNILVTLILPSGILVGMVVLWIKATTNEPLSLSLE